MKKIFYSFGVLLLIVAITLTCVFIFNNKSKSNDILGSYINISELSDEFIDKYHSDMEELRKKDNTDNVLIVVSKEKPDDYGASMVVEAPNNTYILQYDDEHARDVAKDKFEKDNNIFSVTENRKYTYSDDSSSSDYNSWGIEKEGLDHAIEYINQNGGENVTVAIIDSGCDMDLFNQSYEGKITEVYNLYNVGVYGRNVMFDNGGHGTHIAGTIAEGTPDNVKILPIKVGDAGPYLDSLAILEGIYYIVEDHKADVINMSFGSIVSEVRQDAEFLAIESARRENIISVAAAGNSGSDLIEVPSAYNNTISIGAVDSNLSVAGFSTHNYMVTFSAPGVDINSINGVKSGTSMATPHAVCAVAFLKSIQKNLSFDAVISALRQNSVDLGAPGRDDYYGYGFIDLSSFSICSDDDLTSCTVLDIEEEFEPTHMEFEEAVLTPYNYGSITNIMPTKVRLIDDNDKYVITTIDTIDAEISGYDPYAVGNQTVTITYLDSEVSFTVSNPENYEMGWVYMFARDHEGNPTENYAIVGYKDNGMHLKKLYVPETIDNHTVVKLSSADRNYPFVFSKSEDVKEYTELTLPSSINLLQGDEGISYFVNLYKFVSLTNELEIRNSVFSFMSNLTIVDANILLTEYSKEIFYYDKALKEVRISPNSTIIPYRTFYNCFSLKNIVIPNNVTEIGNYAFYQSGIRSIELPNNLQKIGDYAFYETRIEEITIPDSVTYIGDFAFINSLFSEVTLSQNITHLGNGAFGGIYLDKISISSNNPIYDSRNNSNAIYETDSNKLIIGSNRTVVPLGVKEIGDYAFKESSIMSVDLPEGVEKIGIQSFSNCRSLKTIKFPSTINSISEDNFNIYDSYGNIYFSSAVVFFYVYRNSIVYDFVIDHRKAYVLRDYPEPPEIIGLWFNGKTDYVAYDTLDINSYTASVYYEGMDEPEIVREFRNPIYEHGDSIRYGDMEALLYFDTAQGYYNIEMSIPIDSVEKATPEYEIPTDIYGNVNSALMDVDLPKGFVWENSAIVLNEVGDVVYNATFYPEDTDNFRIVEHIPIPIHVIDKTLIKPTITILDKVYDGTNILPTSNYIIEDIDSNYYTVESAIVTSTDAGAAKAQIKLKLTEDKYLIYAFSNGRQEKVFEYDINVLPIEVLRPTRVDKTYVYNGEYQTLLINGFDSNAMNIEGNIEKDAGYYYAVVSLKNNNYAWDSGFNGTVWIQFIIEKADIDYTASDTEAIYDGNQHGINIEVTNENAVIKYRDSNGEYTLDEMPKYTDIGTYTIGYKISIDNNYNEVIGENTLTIIDHGIINNTEDVEVVYDGNNHTITLDLNVEDYIAHYSINNTDYNLDTLPQFKEAGEYTINYRIDKEGYDSITGSNKVKIYGISELDPSLLIKDNNLIVSDKTFDSITNKITIYSKTAEISHLDSEDNEVTRNEIKTGDKIHIRINNTATLDYNISLLGDIDEDGVTSIRDMYQVFLLYKNKSTGLTPAQIAAADFNNDGRITIMDLYHVYLKMKGKE